MLLEGKIVLASPDLMLYEVANILHHKKARLFVPTILL